MKKAHARLWASGYFCAVAVLCKETQAEGCADTDVVSLFRQGGDWRMADPEDIQTFLLHGLLLRTEETDHLTRSLPHP
jgi:hypothetical protein